MKNYLKEALSDDEKKYIFGIINKVVLKYIRESSQKLEKECMSIDDDEFPEQLLLVEDTYNFLSKNSKTEMLREILTLEPYSKYEKEKIVETLDNILKELEISNHIASLTFNEKLVVFLLYLEGYNVNQVATLLNVNRKTIRNRNTSIKRKFEKVKESLTNEK